MVVVSGSRVRKVTAYPVAGTPSISPTPSDMSARAVLTSRPNSYPFQDRTLILNTPAKVGRAVARARAATNNAIFDCKVLSRHHALLWYENGIFYLQDTKSSNGTFVNNNRLSDGSKESAPREVSSGDIVQFGVDVVENNRRVTHGCIIATLSLYLPDGKEAKASQAVCGSTLGTSSADELCRLSQHLREAARRELKLETKLTALQRLVEQARQAAELGWRAAVDEDRLLSRVAILESQLRTYSKSTGDDSLREELVRLQEDKNAYQVAAKDSLQRLHKERLEAMDKVTVLEQAVANANEERIAALEQCNLTQEELHQLAIQLSETQKQTNELTEKLEEAEAVRTELEQVKTREQSLNVRIDTMKRFVLNPNILVTLRNELRQAKEKLETSELKLIKDSEENMDDIQEIQIDADARKTCEKLQEQIDILEKVLPSPIINKSVEVESDPTNVNLNTHEQMTALDKKLKNELESNAVLTTENENLRQKLLDAEQLSKERKNEAQQMRDKLQTVLADLDARPSQADIDDNLSLIRKSQELIKNLENENLRLETEVEKLSGGASTDSLGWNDVARVSELEDELVLIKEKHAQCVPERTKLERDLQNALEEVRSLTTRSQTVLFCYVAPLVLVIAYLLLRSAFA